MNDEMNETPTATEVESPVVTALRAYAEKLLTHMPDGWSFFMSERDGMPLVMLVPPAETLGWYAIEPSGETYRIVSNMGIVTGNNSFKSKHPSAQAARNILYDFEWKLIEVQAEREARARHESIRRVSRDVLSAVNEGYAYAGQLDEDSDPPVLTITRTDDRGQEWHARAYAKERYNVRLELDDVTIMQAIAILRALDA